MYIVVVRACILWPVVVRTHERPRGRCLPEILQVQYQREVSGEFRAGAKWVVARWLAPGCVIWGAEARARDRAHPPRAPELRSPRALPFDLF